MSLFNSFLIITILLTLALFIIGHFLPVRNPDINKIHPYECGFDPITSNRLPFSFRFFLVAILFLIFDLEIAIVLPIPLSFLTSNLNNSILPLLFFFFILVIGLIYEWYNGGLEWAE
uniref:NADH-ubiquinone oxidoreductase chain 3 n=1 Tax=Ophiarachnella infernalis TaxID=2587522 RepID=A0A513X077_9ECHI|nr:NADH dehydrogenase subunit 3 [Ophiarachnella infernalis]